MQSTDERWVRDYDEINAVLEGLEAGQTASELHGHITGLHCAKVYMTPDTWFGGFLKELTAEITQHRQAAEMVAGGQVDDVLQQYDPADDSSVSVEVEIGHEDAEQLKSLYSATLRDLKSEEIAFTPILPDDEHYSLSDRVAGLGQWVRGYLVGIGLSGVQDDSLDDDIKEALRDLVSISQIDHEVDDEDEDGEKSLFDLTEYVRVLVLTIYGQLEPVTIN